jgi:hypothetical protein
MRQPIIGIAIAVYIVFGLLTLPLTAQAVKSSYRIDVPIDGYTTPTEAPCLSETVHVFGTYQEHFIDIITNTGIEHTTVHQTTNLTGVGLTTGATYQIGGPLTLTMTGDPNNPFPFEGTLHNITSLIGPGLNGKVYFRTLLHFTWDQTTFEPKVTVDKSDVLCR